MELGGDAGEGFGWWGEALAGTGGGGFEFRGGEDAQGTNVADGEMLFDSLLLGEWEFAVDEGAELVRSEMVWTKTLGGLICLRRLIHRDSPRCGCRS